MTHFSRFNKIFSILILFLCSHFSAMSFASVEIRTGSFSHVTTDIDGLERTYSNSYTQKGLFGEKWKTVYDNRLDIDKKENTLSVFNAIENKYHKFRLNSNGVWQGTSGTMTKINNNYTWEHKESQYIFNAQGSLIEYHVDEYEFYTLKYDSDGNVRYFVTYENAEYDIDTNNEGSIIRFTRINADFIDLVEYVYQDNLLVNVVEKNNKENPVTTIYQYDYDSYLTSLDDGNNYRVEISYEKYAAKVRVNKYKHYSSTTYYKYKLISSNSNENHYSVTTYKERNGDEHKKRFEYIDVYHEGKFTYTRNIKKYINNKLVYDGEYLNKCKPSSVINNGKETVYSYDAEGRMLSKETESGIINYQYNSQGKITYIQRMLKNDPGSEKWAQYSYNQNNNLVNANNSEGLKLNLQYDKSENIVVMSTQDKTLYISYNHLKKPSKISVQGLGSINVTYDENGEVLSVNSEGEGHKLALEVTRAFQDLLVIISAATKNTI